MRLKLLVIFCILLGLQLACTSASSTSTPVQTSTPLPTVAPTATSAPTVVATTPPTPRPMATNTPEENQPKYGGILQGMWFEGLDIDNLDPQKLTSYNAYGPMYSIYNNLVGLAPDDSIVPELVKSWDESSDGKQVTLHLQQGVLFQDGTPFNAQTVKWDIERILDPNTMSPRAPDLEALDHVEVKDNYTVVLYLKTAFRPLLAEFTDRTGWVPSPTAVEKYGKDFGSHPVGTGPFKFKAWVPQEYVEVERFDQYWVKGQPYLDGVKFIAGPDTSIMLAAIRTGEVDAIEVAPTDIPILKDNPNVRIMSKESYTWGALVMNPQIPPFNNRSLRQAITQAIDRQTVVNTLLNGAGRPAYTPIQGGWANDPTIKPLPYDPSAARQKLAEAGYPDGLTIPYGCLATTTGVVSEEACEIFQAMLKKVGINADIKLMPASNYWGTEGFVQKVGMGNNWWGQRADPHIVLNWVFYSKGYWNNGRMVDSELDSLIEQAAATYDLSKARELYSKIGVLAAQDAWWASIYFTNGYVALRTTVQNYTLYADLKPRLLSEVWLK